MGLNRARSRKAQHVVLGPRAKQSVGERAVRVIDDGIHPHATHGVELRQRADVAVTGEARATRYRRHTRGRHACPRPER